MIWRTEPCGSQWLAQDAGILAVITVVDVPADVRAQEQGALLSSAFDVVQEDRASAGAKVGLSRGCQRLATPQLTAQDHGCPEIPRIVANGAPPLS